jgi:hypothetical protein
MSDEDQQAGEIEAIAESLDIPVQSDFSVLKNDESTPETSEIIHPLLVVGFSILAPNWQVQDEEVQQLSVAYSGLIDKYFPEGLGDHGLEINAFMITAAIVLPRMRTPRKLEEQEMGNNGD